MTHGTTLHGIKNIKIEKPENAKHSEKRQTIVFETKKGRNHEVRAFGDFEVNEVDEK